MRNAVVILAAAAIMVLGVIGSGIIFLDEQRLKSLVAQHVENHTGRRIEIRGPLRVRLFPGLRLSAEQVIMLPPDDFDGPELFRAERVDMRVRILALVRGRVDASDVRLSGARINLHTDPAGRSSLEGLGRDRAPGIADWTSGPVTLEHAVVNFSDAGRSGREVLEMERIDLAGVAPGRPVEFRFRGNMEEPAAFDSLEVDGLLVPGGNGAARLSNMRLQASMDGGRYQLELRGNVSYVAEPPMRLELDGGQLIFNEHRFLVEGNYLAGDRPYLSAALASDFFDVDVLALAQKLGDLSRQPSDAGLLTALRGFDFDVAVDLGRVAELGLVLNGVVLAMEGRSGLVALALEPTEIPGALLAGSASLDLRQQPPLIESLLAADISSMAALLESLRLSPFIDGQGNLILDLEATAAAGDPGSAAWAGSGTLELWDGSWPLLADLKQGATGGIDGPRFELLRTDLLLSETTLKAPGLRLVSEDLVVSGETGFLFADQALFGRLHLDGAERMELVELAGSLADPLVVRTPLVLPPAQ
ncbi:MAG: AsmA family protein [Wenzhouxiangella sp.]|nr:MAG: AsmA family protein [Wenzhouxiangella sp.]